MNCLAQSHSGPLLQALRYRNEPAMVEENGNVAEYSPAGTSGDWRQYSQVRTRCFSPGSENARCKRKRLAWIEEPMLEGTQLG